MEFKLEVPSLVYLATFWTIVKEWQAGIGNSKSFAPALAYVSM